MDEIINFKAQEAAEKTNDLIKNDKSASARKAEDFIKYQTGANESSPNISVDKQGRINVDRVRKIRIDHKHVASDILKMVHIIPNMSLNSRRVMSIRVMNPGITTMGISLSTGLPELSVKQYEREGLEKIKDHLRKTKYDDVVEKAVKDIKNEKIDNYNLQGQKNSLLQ